MPPTAAIPRFTVNFPRNAGQPTLFSSLLEAFVGTVGIDAELDREVAFAFGESGHVFHGVAFRCSALIAFRGLLYGLSRLIEEAPNAFRNARDRGYGIGDQIPRDIRAGLQPPASQPA